MDTSRILIVDDEPAVRLTLSLALEDTPYVVEAVETAEEALTALDRERYDLLIVDKNLPGMNGAELIKKVRLSHEDVWSAMITGYPSADSAMEMLHLGVRGYLEKPFENVYEVVRRVEQILEQKRTAGRMRDLSARLRNAANLLPTTRGLKIVIAVADAGERRWLAGRTGSGMDSTVAVASFNDALTLMRNQAPDVVVCDGAEDAEELFGFIEDARLHAPELTFAVIAEAPSLRMLTQLIDAGVAAVLPRPLVESSYRARLDGVLLQLRAGPPRASRLHPGLP